MAMTKAAQNKTARKNERISVAVVTRDRSALLAKTLESIARQTVMPDEVVVVDNASIDDTRKMVKSFESNLPILYLYCEEIGVNAARNCALKNSTGDVLLFTDDDAEAEPEWVEEMSKSLKKHPDAAAIVGVKGNLFPYHFTACLVQFTRRSLSMLRDRDKEFVLSPTIVDTCNIAIRRAIVMGKGLSFDNTLVKGGDRHFGHQMFDNSLKVMFCETSIVLHRWPLTMAEYFKMRYSSGQMKIYLQDRAGGENRYKSVTRHWGLIDIVGHAWGAAGVFSFPVKLAFLFFVGAGQVWNVVGYIMARIEKSRGKK
ncbi:glycosyltransferase [Desulfobacterales bacterium HSG16]|nr:glycosyltransferase [Desulfobacterales bacterium HSG16]